MSIKNMLKRSHSDSDDLDNIYKRQKLNNKNMPCQVYKMKCSIIHPEFNNLMYDNNENLNANYGSQVFGYNNCNDNGDNYDNLITSTSEKPKIENQLLFDNSEYEQINNTLKNLHKHRKYISHFKMNNDNMIDNPTCTDFYTKINSQLKLIHMANLKQHGKEYSI